MQSSSGRIPWNGAVTDEQRSRGALIVTEICPRSHEILSKTARVLREIESPFQHYRGFFAEKIVPLWAG